MLQNLKLLFLVLSVSRSQGLQCYHSAKSGLHTTYFSELSAFSPSVLWVRALNVVKATECHDRCGGVAERLSEGARRTAQEGA